MWKNKNKCCYLLKFCYLHLLGEFGPVIVVVAEWGKRRILMKLDHIPGKINNTIVFLNIISLWCHIYIVLLTFIVI